MELKVRLCSVLDSRKCVTFAARESLREIRCFARSELIHPPDGDPGHRF